MFCMIYSLIRTILLMYEIEAYNIGLADGTYLGFRSEVSIPIRFCNKYELTCTVSDMS